MNPRMNRSVPFGIEAVSLERFDDQVADGNTVFVRTFTCVRSERQKQPFATTAARRVLPMVKNAGAWTLARVGEFGGDFVDVVPAIRLRVARVFERHDPMRLEFVECRTQALAWAQF